MKSFLAGLGLGYAVGLLLAPEAGAQTRERVKDSLHELTNQGRKLARPLANAVRARGEDRSQTTQVHGIQGHSEGESEAAGNSEVLEILNSASKTKLMSVPGIGDATARRIIESRPYASPESVVGDGILSEELMSKLEKKLLTEEENAA